MKRLSGLLQFMLGFVMGVAILVGGATAVAYMLLSGMNSNPPKPVFTEEKKEETKEEKTAVKPSPIPTTPVQEQPQAEVKESPTAAPAPKASPKPSPEARKREATSEGYQARVTWQSGLSLRSSTKSFPETQSRSKKKRSHIRGLSSAGDMAKRFKSAL